MFLTSMVCTNYKFSAPFYTRSIRDRRQTEGQHTDRATHNK